jgi:putative membrane protein
VLLILVGGARVAFAAKGWAWYDDNVWFWGKIATFLLVALLSVPPTLRDIAWRRAFAADAAWTPDAAEIARVRRFIGLQVIGIAVIIVFAATMARYQGLAV